MDELAYASVGSSSRSQRSSFDFVTVSEGATTFTRTYDERGRLKTFTTADGDPIQYKYDANNNLTRLTYPPDTAHPSGKQVSYTYNARNLLATVTDWSGRLTTYTYDRLGRLTGTIRPNGTSNQIAHDAANQLTSIKESAGGKLINYLAFQYDAASQIKSRFRAPLNKFSQEKTQGSVPLSFLQMRHREKRARAPHSSQTLKRHFPLPAQAVI